MPVKENVEYSLYGKFSSDQPPKKLWTTLDLYCNQSDQYKAYRVEFSNSLVLDNAYNSNDWELKYYGPPEEVDGLTRRRKLKSIVKGDICEIAHFFLPTIGSTVRSHRLHIGHIYTFQDTIIKIYNIVEPKDKFYYGDQFYQLYLDVMVEIIGEKDQVTHIRNLLKGLVDLQYIHNIALRKIPEDEDMDEESK